MSTKKNFRTLLLEKRRQISAEERQRAAQTAADLFLATPFFQHHQHIACYYPFNDEFDCSPIIHRLWSAQKKCYLPILPATKEERLDFVEYKKNSILQSNRYQILEPVKEKKVPLETLEVVLFPLVGFDYEGNRLGMGAGFYDRTFAKIQHENAKKNFFIGLGYESQGVSTLPHDAWDVKLDAVITEKRVIFFAK